MDAVICERKKLPWSRDAREDLGRVISEGLVDTALGAPLSVVGLAGPDAPMTLVMDEDLPVAEVPYVTRAAHLPTPPRGRRAPYWRILAKQRFVGGAYLVREQGVILEDGKTSLAVVGLCVGLVRGAVEVDLLWWLAG